MSSITEIPRGSSASFAPLFDDAEMAGALRITARHLRTLRSRRVIPFVKLGKLIRYSPADVSSAIDKLTVRAREKEGGAA